MKLKHEFIFWGVAFVLGLICSMAGYEIGFAAGERAKAEQFKQMLDGVKMRPWDELKR